jgi:ribosomal-protein-alanine N-acetyltransferase
VERATILETPRLRLTTWSEVDVDELYELHSDPETMRYIRKGQPESRAECADLLAHYLTEQALGWTKWRLTDPRGRMIGRAGFGLHHGARALSYTIRRDRWGEGLATEIGNGLVRWHRENETERLPLLAHVAVANPASARVVTKLGFVVRAQEVVVGELCDVFHLPDDRP